MKNILDKTRTYLVGHMQYASGRDWREYVESALEPVGIRIFNPYKKPFVKDVNEDEDTRLSIDHCMKHGYFNDVAERMKLIRSYDLNLVDRSDFIIAHFGRVSLSCYPDNLLKAFGGFRLFWAAAAVWAILPVLLAWAIYPDALWIVGAAIAALLALHYILAIPFFRFVGSNSERPCPVKVGPVRNIGLRLLVAIRAACWVAGTLFGVGQYVRGRARYYTNVILSILHFWRPGRISKIFYLNCLS